MASCSRSSNMASSCSAQMGRPNLCLIVRRSRCLRPQVVARGIQTDNATRVKGNVRAVFSYVADYRNLDAWWPGAKVVKTTRGEGKALSKRHQFLIDQSFGPLIKQPTLYEVVEVQQDKKVVYSVGNETFTATEQLVFMPDQNDPSFTIVRHMASLELSAWRKTLAPVLSSALRSVPEQAVLRLGALLNGPQSPLSARDRRRTTSPPRERERASGRDTGGAQGGTVGGGWNFNNFLDSLKTEAAAAAVAAASAAANSSRSSSSTRASSSSSARAGSNGARAASSNGRAAGGGSRSGSTRVRMPSEEDYYEDGQLDALGYYAVLGLDGTRPQLVSPDEVKTAFRKAAQTMHPDKFSMADDDEREAAQEAFKKVQAAYEVLRDPQQRWLYDQGRMDELRARQAERLEQRSAV